MHYHHGHVGYQTSYDYSKFCRLVAILIVIFEIHCAYIPIDLYIYTNSAYIPIKLIKLSIMCGGTEALRIKTNEVANSMYTIFDLSYLRY